MNFTQMLKTSRSLVIRFALMLAVLTFIPYAAQAATKTWLGNTDTNWNTSANWGSGPLVSGDTPVFGVAGISGIVLNNDTPAGTSYAGITFNNSAGSFVIGGNSITLAGNIAGGNPSTEILNFDIALNTTPTISGANSVFTLGGVISGAGYGLTRSAGTTLKLTGLNTFDGVVTLSAGTLIATTLANGGSPSSIGMSGNAAGNLLLANATIFKYAGPEVATDRSFTINGTAAGHGVTLDASGTGAINFSNTATPSYGIGNQTRTLSLFSSNPGTNTLAALITDNGSGAVGVTKSGYGTWVLSGENTYSGKTTISLYGIPNNGGPLAQYNILVATMLANGGSPSSIGQSGNAAANLLLGAATTLKYTGPATSTDRAFTINGDANNNESGTLDASGTGAIQWTSTAAVAYGTANYTRTLYLTGNNTENNTLSALIGNNGTATTSLGKGGQGTWVLNGPVVNTYTGGTTVVSGTLVEDFSNMTSGYANLINSNSPLTLGGGTLSLSGHGGNASSQTFGNPAFSAGGVGSGISLSGASGMTLTLGSTWTRNVGSTVNVTLGTGGTLSSSPTTANTLVVGNGNIAFATAGGTDWAKVTSGSVVAFTGGDYNTTFPSSASTSTVNYSLTGNGSVTSTETANTLKINTSGAGQALALTSGQTLTLNAGGLLFVGADDYIINGGTLKGSGGTQKELVVHQFGAGNLTIGSVIADNGAASALTKSGTGTLTLTNANTHTGATYAGGGGTLVLMNQLALQNSPLTVDNSSLVFDSSVTANAFTLGGLSSAAPYIGPGYDIVLQNNAGTPAPIALTIGNGNSSGNYYGTLSGSGSLIKVGAGVQNMYGVNSYTGTTTINGGTLACGFAMNDWFLGGGGPNGNVQVTVGSAGTLALNRNNITGTMTLNGGTVTQGNGWGATWGGSIILTATSTMNITGGLTVPAVVSGTGGLTKTGNSIVTLSSANTYSGPTAINAGTLALTYSGSINYTPSISIAAGGTFDVSGISAYILSANTTLAARGTGIAAGTTAALVKGASGGSVSLGAQPLILNFTPTGFSGDTTHPSLVVTNSALTLNNNAFTVTNTTGTALGAGTYRLILVGNGSTGTINQNASPAYAVTVTGKGIVSDTYASVAVNPGQVNLIVTATTPTQLAFTTQPVNTTAGTTMSNVVVQIQDASGNAVAHSGTSITLALSSGTFTSGTITRTTDGSGKATFNDLVIQTSGTGLTLTASGTYTSAISSSFNITAASANKLGFTTQPVSASAGATMANVVVQVQDSFGNAVAQSGMEITLTLNGGSGLSGTNPQITDGTGVATFNDLQIGTAANNLSFTANGGGLTAATSTLFTIVAGADVPTKWVVTAVNGGSNPTAGTPYSVTVEAQDINGTARNVSVDTGVTLTLSSGTPGSLGGTLTGTLSSGSSSVTMSGVTNSVAEHVTLLASTSSGTSLLSGSANYSILPSSAALLTVTGYPSLQWVGAAGSVTVTAKDAYGNTATNYTGTVHLTSSDVDAGKPDDYTFLGSDLGVHTFTPGVTLNTPGPQSITVTDTVTGTITGTQSGITVYPYPALFAWTNTVSGTWSTAGNWTNDVGVLTAPFAAGQMNYVLNFNKAGTYTATHNLNDGFLLNQINFGGATVTLGGYSLAFTNNGATLPQINQNSTFAVTVNNDVTLSESVTFGGSSNGQVDLTGLISGSGSLTKNGSGTLRVYNVNNSFTGGTVINSGTLFMDINAKLGTGSVTLNGGNLYMWRFKPTNALTVNGGSITSENGFNENLWAGPITLNTNLTCDVVYQLTCSGVISGDGGLIKTSGATMILTATNTFTGTTTVGAGTLQINSSGQLASHQVVVTNAALLKLSNSSSLAETVSVTIADGGAKIDIPNGVTQTINMLYLGSDGKPEWIGTWGHSSSDATNKDDVHFTATSGKLRVMNGLQRGMVITLH